MKKYVFAKPDRPNWAAAVEHAAKLLKERPEETLIHTCQNVPLKYLQQLRREAEALNKV